MIGIRDHATRLLLDGTGLSAGVGPNLTTMNTPTQINPTELHSAIKLGIDAHAKWFYVGRQFDGATPQPVQKMTFDREIL